MVGRIPDVEAVDCPASTAVTFALGDVANTEHVIVRPHRIVPIKGGREWRCGYCGETWADLDAQVRR